MIKATRVHSTPPTNTPISGATSRRNFLANAAGIAAGGTALALAAIPASAVSLRDDPIFAAIDTHMETVGMVERLLAPSVDDPYQMQAALMAECAAAKVLIATAPSTHAGLRALEIYLREDRQSNAWMGIRMTGTTEAGRPYTWSSVGPEGVDWLIAKRRADIVEAA